MHQVCSGLRIWSRSQTVSGLIRSQTVSGLVPREEEGGWEQGQSPDSIWSHPQTVASHVTNHFSQTQDIITCIRKIQQYRAVMTSQIAYIITSLAGLVATMILLK